MRIAIVNLGSTVQCMLSSCMNKYITANTENPSITWFVSDPNAALLLKFSKSINKVSPISDLVKSHNEFDVLINLDPDFDPKMLPANCQGFGIHFNQESDLLSDIVCGKSHTKMNMFQVYLKIAGSVWRGESYDLQYYPRSRSKKNRIGLAISNAKLRNYVFDSLSKENSKSPWIIPYRKNVLKQMDEVNRCGTVITDDILTTHLSIYLRKNVHLLNTANRKSKIEFFGHGAVYNIPGHVLETCVQ